MKTFKISDTFINSFLAQISSNKCRLTKKKITVFKEIHFCWVDATNAGSCYINLDYYTVTTKMLQMSKMNYLTYLDTGLNVGLKMELLENGGPKLEVPLIMGSMGETHMSSNGTLPLVSTKPGVDWLRPMAAKISLIS